MRIPIQDQRLVKERGVSTPSLGQAGTSSLTEAGRVLSQLGDVTGKANEIREQFDTLRLQQELNALDNEISAEGRGAEGRDPGLYQTQGTAAMNYQDRLHRLKEFRAKQLEGLSSSARRRYELMSEARLREAEGDFRTYATRELRGLATLARKEGERIAVEKASGATSFEEAEKHILRLDFMPALDDEGRLKLDEEGKPTFLDGATTADLKLLGVPEDIRKAHFDDLRKQAHAAAIKGQLDAKMFDEAEKHLAQAAEILPAKVQAEFRKVLADRRLDALANDFLQSGIALSARESPWEDARWTDEEVLAKRIEAIPDDKLRAKVSKLNKDSEGRRKLIREGAIDNRASEAWLAYFKGRHSLNAISQDTRDWLQTNARDEWQKLERFHRGYLASIRAGEKHAMEKSALQAYEGVMDLRVDFLNNPAKFADPDYTTQSFIREYGERIGPDAASRGVTEFLRVKEMATKGDDRAAIDAMRNEINRRTANLKPADKRKYTGLIMEQYDAWRADPKNQGRQPSREDVSAMFSRTDIEVKIDGPLWFTPKTRLGEAVINEQTIVEYKDPKTGKWVEGEPPDDLDVTDVRTAPAKVETPPVDPKRRRAVEVLKAGGYTDPSEAEILEVMGSLQ